MQLNGALKELSPEQAKELGRRLSARREELGLTVRDVERLAGVDDATVARLENGVVPDPRPATVRAICEALDLVVADVYPSPTTLAACRTSGPTCAPSTTGCRPRRSR